MKVDVAKTLLGTLLVPLLFPALTRAEQATCPSRGETRRRTAQQVWDHRLAAFHSGDLDALMCDYADDVTLTLPDQTLRGKTAVRDFFAPIFSCVVGDQVTVKSVTPVDDRYILLVFSVESVACPGVIIEEGVETFLLEKGLISGQTLHTR